MRLNAVVDWARINNLEYEKLLLQPAKYILNKYNKYKYRRETLVQINSQK